MNPNLRQALAIAIVTFSFILFLQVQLTTVPYTNIVLTKGYDSDSSIVNTLPSTNNEGSNRLLATTIREDDRLAPKVSWVMSFPLSGGDYAIDVVHRITHRATGTNYGNVMEEPTGIQVRNTKVSMPIFHERLNGPFYFVNHLALPSTFIPVTTHCSGFCWDCFPGRYTDINFNRFIASCAESKMFIPSPLNQGQNGFGKTQEFMYDHNMVKQAVLMVRNPFDTVDERFLYSTRTYSTDKEWLPRFEPNPRGFHDFCDEAAVKYDVEELRRYEPTIYQVTRDVPCHHEFYKLIQWYNFAFQTLETMNLEPRIINYEDLANKDTFASTAVGMLHFFGLTPIVDPSTSQPPLVAQGPLHYLTMAERKKVIGLFEVMASEKTMSVFKRYFA